jgi:hypothetical protein
MLQLLAAAFVPLAAGFHPVQSPARLAAHESHRRHAVLRLSAGLETTADDIATIEWGGDLANEVQTAVRVVQRAMQLCQSLACDMAIVDSSAGGKEMDACDTTAGVSFIKEGDSSARHWDALIRFWCMVLNARVRARAPAAPVTAADFAIQGLVSRELSIAFPADRFMGEEDASDLREDSALRALALRLCGSFGGDTDEAGFLDSVDRGLAPRVADERVWILDPIDGTKGFMTGESCLRPAPPAFLAVSAPCRQTRASIVRRRHWPRARRQGGRRPRRCDGRAKRS